MDPFGVRLRQATDRCGRLCVGIDPSPALLADWGLSDDASGLASFASVCVEAFASEVAVLKPQSAFFERHGSSGIAVLERFVAAARLQGALVLLDAKRGDIGSTMTGYADAYLDQASPLAVDAVTVHPFLGFESLRPMLDAARGQGAGVFVLALTSNPEGGDVQQARTANGSVAGDVLSAIGAENASATPQGCVGAVVAANLSEIREDLAVNGPLLAPGLGAQGGTVDDIRRNFDRVRDFVLPSASRAVLRAGPEPRQLADAARRLSEAVSAALAP